MFWQENQFENQIKKDEIRDIKFFQKRLGWSRRKMQERLESMFNKKKLADLTYKELCEYSDFVTQCHRITILDED